MASSICFQNISSISSNFSSTSILLQEVAVSICTNLIDFSEHGIMVNVFGNLSYTIGLICLLITSVSTKPIEKRSTQVSLGGYTYTNGVLSGTITLQNIAFQKVVNIHWAAGSSFPDSQVISGAYQSGPGSDGYETWKFSGNAAGATQFYIEYVVNGNKYYDPGNFKNYQITPSQPTTTTTSAGTTTTPTPSPTPTGALDSWLATEYTVAASALKRNIGSDSNTLIPKGTVIASPSTDGPNYYYQWIRDASLVMGHIVKEYLEDTSSNLQYVLNWITSQQTLQHTSNPSGSFTSGGLGEPKFNVDNTAYTGAWGRPQRDGPALRAITLMNFATQYKSVNSSFVSNVLYGNSNSVIKADLDYVVQYWSQSGFDLWEEVNGQHFFTLMVSYRSLLDGAKFAQLMGDSASASTYSSTAAGMVSTIRQFWNSNKGYLVATLNSGRSGVDCGTLLGGLHGDASLYPPSSDEILATTNALVSSFQSLYPINAATSGPAYAIGRYPEDVYDGTGTSQANPWFICTATVAHVLYNSVSAFKSKGSVSVTSTSQAMFARAVPGIATGTYSASSATFTNIVNGFNSLGDGFLGVVRAHASSNGSLSEQFSRTSGVEIGARDLTWSYESILEAIKARNAAK